MKSKVKQMGNKKEKPLVKKTCDPRKSHAQINQIKFDAPRRMKATVLFSCAGICEYYLPDIGVDVVLANELEADRAKLHHALYSNCTMVIGDITKPSVQDKLAEIANREQCEILMGSPKCQQFTKANTQKDSNSNELLLFEEMFKHLDRCPCYKYVVIENAEEFKDFHIEKLGDTPVGQHIIDEFEKRGFIFHDIGVQNAKYFNTAMNRDRTIIVASRVKQVRLPKPLTVNPLTSENVIDDLPTLEGGQRGPHWADVTEYVSPAQVAQIRITPTGVRVDKPLTLSGKVSGAIHHGAFCRARWDEVMHSALTNNGELSAYHMIHPGRLIVDSDGQSILDKDGNEQFTDCRTFTPHELFRALRLPDDINIPIWARQDMSLIRECIGECWAPLHAQAVIYEFVKAEFDLEPLTKDSFFETNNDFFTIAAEHTTKCWERVNPNAYFNINAFKIMFICEGIDFALHYLGQTQGFFNLKAKVSQQTEMEKSCFGLAAHYARNRLIERGYCTDCDLKSLTDMFKKNGLVFTQLYIRYVRSEEEFLNIFSKAKTYKGGD